MGDMFGKFGKQNIGQISENYHIVIIAQSLYPGDEV